MLSLVKVDETVLADGAGGGVAGVVVESVLADVAFEEFCVVEEFSGAERAMAAFVDVVTGNAAELTRVCTFVRLPEGAGKTTPAASESSFCKMAESPAGAGGAGARVGCGAAVPMLLGARFFVESEIRFAEMAGVARAAARIEGSTEVKGALGNAGAVDI